MSRSFLDCGGNSVKSVELWECLKCCFEMPLLNLLDKLLNESLNSVVDFITAMQYQTESEKQNTGDGKTHALLANKLDIESADTKNNQKKPRLDKHHHAVANDHTDFFSISRGCKFSPLKPAISEAVICSLRNQHKRLDTGKGQLKTNWCYDTGKCVDASPVLLIR